jgi:hypothetical protein
MTRPCSTRGRRLPLLNGTRRAFRWRRSAAWRIHGGQQGIPVDNRAAWAARRFSGHQPLLQHGEAPGQRPIFLPQRLELARPQVEGAQPRESARLLQRRALPFHHLQHRFLQHLLEPVESEGLYLAVSSGTGISTRVRREESCQLVERHHAPPSDRAESGQVSPYLHDRRDGAKLERELKNVQKDSLARYHSPHSVPLHT